ncbi:nucleotidyltransferase family protein [Aegicerativicinus sediminis]
MTLLLMAAGRGSRYGSLKQFDEFGPNGEFLMEYSMFDALKYGFKHIVVVTQESNREFLRSYLEKRLPKHIKLDVVVQSLNDIPEIDYIPTDRTKPWGTAQAVWSARHVITNSFVVINADDFYGSDAFRSAANFIESQGENEYGLMGYVLSETLSQYGPVSRGICQTSNGHLIGVQEITQLEASGDLVVDRVTNKEFSANDLVSMNFWVCHPKIFKEISRLFVAFLKGGPDEKEEFYLPKVIQQLLNENKISVKVLSSSAKWFGITYQTDKLMAKNSLVKLIEKGEYPSTLW